MRRTDRQVTDIKEILAIIEKCAVCRLGFSGDMPYIVPLNFGFSYENDRLTLYFHSAGEGEKLNRLKNSPKVCFEMDCNVQTFGGVSPCSWTARYESVIGFGNAQFITDEYEKEYALTRIMEHYGFSGEMNFERTALEQTTVFSVSTDSFTAKRNG